MKSSAPLIGGGSCNPVLRLPRLVPVITLLILVLPGTAARADAAPLGVRVAPRSGPPTTAFDVRGRGFSPGETIDVTFSGQTLGTATADGTGGFTLSHPIGVA